MSYQKIGNHLGLVLIGLVAPVTIAVPELQLINCNVCARKFELNSRYIIGLKPLYINEYEE